MVFRLSIADQQMMTLFFPLLQILTNIWLSEWSNDDPYDANGTFNRELADYRLGVYGGLGAFQGTSFTDLSPIWNLNVGAQSPEMHILNFQKLHPFSNICPV